jgi:outer membrane protein OmpA-like peptidoglycan-associated protein
MWNQRAWAASTLSLILGSPLFGGTINCARSDDVNPQPAVAFLAQAVQRHRVVAIAEHHDSLETMELIAELLRDRMVPGTVNDVVVEFGNARYQSLIDAYLAGDAVPPDSLRQVWENTTQVTGVWLSPIYADFFADVRALNASLPPAKRFRVLLGDPPIDWSSVTSPADEDMNDWRDAYFAWVVQHRVLQQNRRAILFIGGGHLSRRVVFPNSLIHLLDRQYPGEVLVVDTLEQPRMDREIAERVARWPRRSAILVRGSWLGQIHASRIGMSFSSGTLQENLDVVVYFGPGALSTVPPQIDWSSAYGTELRRRQALAAGPFRTGRVRFQRDSVIVNWESETAIAAIVEELRRDVGLQVTVKAFADGLEHDGGRLSQQRADALVSRLVLDGIARDRLTARGCGDSRPLWREDTEEHRAANRRADFVRTSSSVSCVPPASFD